MADLSTDTKARVVMAWLKGDADFTQCDGVCCVCGQTRYDSAWAGGAFDPEGRMRGICRKCLRHDVRYFVGDDEAIREYLKKIKRGLL